MTVYVEGRFDVEFSAVDQPRIFYFQDESHVSGTIAWKSNSGSSTTQLG